MVQLRAFKQRVAAFEREMEHILASVRKSTSLVEADGGGGDAPDGAVSLAALQFHSIWANSQQFHALLPATASLAALLHSAHALQVRL